MYQMRRVPQHVAALAQSVHHKRQVKLLEVAHAAMHKLGAAARCSLGKIESFDQQSAIAARGCFNRCAKAAGPAADYQHIPRFCLSAELPQNFRSHGLTCNFLLAFLFRKMGKELGSNSTYSE